MKNFNFGIKLLSSEGHLLGEAEKLIDEGIVSYVEIILNTDFLDERPFLDHEIPYVVHAPHENFGVDIGDISKRDYTYEMIQESVRWADLLGAEFIILHAGTGSAEAAESILSKISDNRLILENMPVKGIYGEKCLGFDSKSISLQGSNLGVCLDFGHAVKASTSLKKDYTVVITGLLGLKPKMFHISDGTLKNEKDEHLSIGQGEYDFEYFKKCIQDSKSKLVTLETPRRNKNSLEEDLKNIKVLKSM